ncbi:hypothetical protein B0H11DRAFT_2249909 [Mycena galericulata]|nr:hypothetical protein B0H11DRAFT_2249909 [Mycena galericulata]
MNFALLVAWLSASVRAETVTLFGFRPNGYPPNVVSLSVGGVGADGATTYIEDILQTVALYGDSPAVALDTAVIPVQTLHATLVADASVYRYSKLPSTGTDGLDGFGVIETCTLDGGGGGICIAQGWVGGGETATTTISGAVIPFYTLTVDPTTTTSTSRNAGLGVVIPSAITYVLPCLLAWLL